MSDDRRDAVRRTALERLASLLGVDPTALEGEDGGYSEMAGAVAALNRSGSEPERLGTLMGRAFERSGVGRSAPRGVAGLFLTPQGVHDRPSTGYVSDARLAELARQLLPPGDRPPGVADGARWDERVAMARQMLDNLEG